MTSQRKIKMISEATIQAEFYHQCRLIGLPCVLELSTPRGRLDCVILSADGLRALAIVEVKRRVMRHTRQIQRYKGFGIPVFGLWQFDRAAKLASQLKRQHYDTNAPGITIDAMMNAEHKLRKFELSLDESITLRS